VRLKPGQQSSGLLEMGTKKKDLPTKPKLGKKPKVPAADDDESNEEDEINKEGAV
jgi:hypothetical protein